MECRHRPHPEVLRTYNRSVTMATYSKSYAVAIAHQEVTHPSTVVGSVLDVSTKLAMTIDMFHAAVESGVANTNPGRFLIQKSAAASGNEDWIDMFEFDATISTADTEAMTATEPVGETALAVVSTAEFVAYDILYIQDTTVVADGEWGKCREITATPTIDLVDGLTNEKDSADVIWNDADMWSVPFDLNGIGRIRVLFMHEGAAGANCHIKALVTYTDSIA